MHSVICLRDADARVCRALRVNALVTSIMTDGNPSGILAGISPAIVPRIDKMAQRVLSLANLNRTVHLPTYNLVIGETALGLKQAAGV